MMGPAWSSARSAYSTIAAIVALASFANIASSEPLCDPHPSTGERFFHDRKLESCRNNVWYSYNDSNTVFVFVHGILSDSRSAWFHKETKKSENNTYWPELVRTDARFGKPSIYLAGYHTEIGSGIYDIRQAAQDLLDALNTSTSDGKDSVLSRNNIIFVAHSMGGIVVRHMLSRAWNVQHFKSKALGLVLVASPSIGSRDANKAGLVSQVLVRLGILPNNEQAWQLRLYSSFLAELDKDFRTMLDRKVLPYISGTELIENNFVIPGRAEQIVTAESAARYFDEGHVIGGTNHSTIAKPTLRKTPSSHTRLVSFFNGPFKTQIDIARGRRPKPIVVLMDSYAKIYEPKPIPGEMNSHVIQRTLQGLPIRADIEPIHINWNDEQEIIEGHPDLIVIHYSSFKEGQIRGSRARARLTAFLETVLSGTNETKVIVYSRFKDDERSVDFTAQVRRLVRSPFRSRVFGFPVFPYGSRHYSFSNGRVAEELRTYVTRILNITQ